MTALLPRWIPDTYSAFMPKRAAGPPRLREKTPVKAMETPVVSSDQDAEGDYDSDVDAEGELDEEPQAGAGESMEGPEEIDEDDSEEDDEEPTIVPHNRRRGGRRTQRVARAKPRKAIDSESDEDASNDESASEAEETWDAEEDEDSDVEDERVELNRCVFCKETEDKDPSDIFEEMLTCAACGEHAHQQCARDEDAELPENESASSWRCPECVEKEDEEEKLRRSRSRRTSSAPRMLRDLLPVQRKPGAHTIFATETYDDDHKTRYKRKASHDPSEEVESRKRSRTSSEIIVLANRNNVHIQEERSRPTTPAQQAIQEDPTPNSRSTRLRQRKSDRPLVTEVLRTEYQYIISFNLDPKILNSVREESRKRKRRERDRLRRERKATDLPVQPKVQDPVHYPALPPTSSMSALFEMHSREGEHSKIKPYGGILTESEADTTRTFPQLSDRKKFEAARLKAEDEWRKKLEAAAAEQARTSQKASSQPSRIKCIHFGGFEIDTWHVSPYPLEYIQSRVLHICEFCLKYMNSDYVAWRHKLKCSAKHPPGDEIYHDGKFSFFEVDGRKNPVYCQNLCLLAKLFLGSKTLYLDVEPFLFYVMTENNNEGCHFVGYFSKEKRSSSQNNVSCILVLPIHQRRGFGHMLIEFSYLLTRVEEKTGSPEKPLSDMGLVSYRSYWRYILCQRLVSQKAGISITDISTETGMTADDVVCALEALRALVKDPVTKQYALRLDYAFFKQYVDTYELKGYPKIDPAALVWVPYVMGRNNSHYENAPIQTVAQRDDGTGQVAPEEGVQLAENDVHIRDFGAGKPNASEDESYGDADSKMQSTDARTTPFPDGNETDASLPASTHAPVTPTTPFVDAEDAGESPIPATRFEVWPPLPGTHRKKGGRGSGRWSARRATPLRQNTTAADSPTSRSKPSTARRTRSNLVEMTNGQSDEADAEGDLDPEMEPSPDEGQEGEGNGAISEERFEEDVDGEGDEGDEQAD